MQRRRACATQVGRLESRGFPGIATDTAKKEAEHKARPKFREETPVGRV